jgi:2-C-methyl-D-erythritol 4-phosphate cytidylyltransferase/2-C-methyl-D-erythritol 2,4-cyclodiphosphate synthase
MARGHADVVVVAAGSSQRFGSDKLDADIGGRPLLAWTIDRLASSELVERIVVVSAPDRVDRIRSAPWLSAKVVDVVPGGARRQESVAHGIGALEGALEERSGTVPDGAPDRIVLVHDGARPLVGRELIAAVVDAVEAHGAAIPILPVVETLKRVGDGLVHETVEREGVGAAQTPQGIRLGILRAAYARFPPDGPREFTDEAALLEACTIPVHVVPGHADNLKVTLPADLDRAASLLAVDRPRVGYGDDSHPFGPGEPLALGGIELAGVPRLSGHSDGDVVLHAVADALLGAAGLNDLGRLFPADARTPRGIASTKLLAEVVSRVAAAGLRPGHVDVTIIGARPRLADRLDSIRGRLAELLLIRVDQVNVKASTGNLDGMEGAGRGISARVVATLERRR